MILQEKDLNKVKEQMYKSINSKISVNSYYVLFTIGMNPRLFIWLDIWRNLCKVKRTYNKK